MVLLLLPSAFLLLPWAVAGRIIGKLSPTPGPTWLIYQLKVSQVFFKSHTVMKSHKSWSWVKEYSVSLQAQQGSLKVNISVPLGAHNIKKKESSQQIFHVGHWVIHPKYSRVTLVNDIVLLKLKPRAGLTKEVSYIFLPSHNERVKRGTTCTVAGWGKTSTSGNKTSVLMEVDLKVQSDEVCEKRFKRKYLRQSMICAGDEHGKKSTLRGDSGGPLVCNGKAHGIVSYGCENRTFPKVFSRVSYFEPWIREELRKFSLQDLPDSPSPD